MGTALKAKKFAPSMGTSLKGENLLPEGAKSKFLPLRAVPYGMENHFYHIR